MITLREAAERLDVTSMRVRQIANAEGFHRKVGNVRVLTPEEFQRISYVRRRLRKYAGKGDRIKRKGKDEQRPRDSVAT